MRLKDALVLLPLAAAANKQKQTIKASSANVRLQYNKSFPDEIDIFKFSIEPLSKVCEDQSLKSISQKLNAAPETSFEVPCECVKKAKSSLKLAKSFLETQVKESRATSAFRTFKKCFQAPAENFILSLPPVLGGLHKNLIYALYRFAQLGDSAADMASLAGETSVSLARMFRKQLNALELENVLDERIEAFAALKQQRFCPK